MNDFEAHYSDQAGRRGRSRTACAQCRRAKVRCGMERMPCSRCRRLGLHCTWNPVSTDVVELRQQPRKRRSILSESHSPESTQGSRHRIMRGQEDPHHSADPTSSSTSKSASYEVSGLTISQEQARHIFEDFFEKFHPFLPFLEPDRPAEEYLRNSKLLFCAIISVAARERHDGHEVLSQCHSFFTWSLGKLLVGGRHNEVRLEDVQALILLALWPWSNTYWWTDRSWTLSSVAVTLAIQIGLHLPLSSTEYSTRNSDECPRLRNERVRTWHTCIAVAQNLNSDFGFSSTIPFGYAAWKIDPSEEESCINTSDDLRHYFCIQHASSSIFHLLYGPDLSLGPSTFSENLIATLPECEHHLAELQKIELSFFNRMNLVASEMYVWSNYFQVTPVLHPDRKPGILRAYSAATRLIELAMTESNGVKGKSSILYHAPRTLLRMLCCAAMIIFRVLYSQYRNDVSYDVGKLLFNSAASNMRHSALRWLDQDAPVRFVNVLRILWDYGEQNPALLESPPVVLVRTRGGASVVYDCLAMIRHPMRPSYDIDVEVPTSVLNPPGQRVYQAAGVNLEEGTTSTGLFSFDWADSEFLDPLF